MGTEYPTSAYTLRSHDHHFDNLDTSGRALLAHVPVALTTTAGRAAPGWHGTVRIVAIAIL